MKIYYCDQIPQQISQHRLAYLLLERGLALDCSKLLGETLRYGRDDYGKPFLEDHPEIQFNISHCKTCVACAIGREPVGIDVERRFPWKEALARRVCHPAEWEWVMEGQDSAARLNLIWSRKESYLKCIGTGIRSDMRKINVLEDPMVQGYGFAEVQTDAYSIVVCGREKAEDFQRLTL